VSEAPIPSAPADLELIARLKSRLQFAELKIRVLEERLRLMRIEKFGASGEKLSHAQMELFELEPVVSEMIEQAESEQAPARRSTKTSCKHPGRRELPPNLPRVEQILPCAPDQRVLQALRQRNRGDRLRGEFPVGCGTGEVLRVGRETRETGLPVV
jgi:hypothetical protein